MEELTCFEQLNINTADPLALWAGQTMLSDHPTPGARAWATPLAVVIYAPALFRRDRVVASGDPEQIVELLGKVSDQFPPHAAMHMTTETADEIGRWITGYSRYAEYGWMRMRSGRTPRDERLVDRFGIRWMRHDEDDTINAVLDQSNPDSWSRPGDSVRTRWVGAFDETGTLVGVGCDAWSSPTVGFINGVGTLPEHRGQGVAGRLCGFLRDELSKVSPWVALMITDQNERAQRLYERLGFSHHPMTVFVPDAGRG